MKTQAEGTNEMAENERGGKGCVQEGMSRSNTQGQDSSRKNLKQVSSNPLSPSNMKDADMIDSQPQKEKDIEYTASNSTLSNEEQTKSVSDASSCQVDQIQCSEIELTKVVKSEPNGSYVTDSAVDANTTETGCAETDIEMVKCEEDSNMESRNLTKLHRNTGDDRRADSGEKHSKEVKNVLPLQTNAEELNIGIGDANLPGSTCDSVGYVSLTVRRNLALKIGRRKKEIEPATFSSEPEPVLEGRRKSGRKRKQKVSYMDSIELELECEPVSKRQRGKQKLNDSVYEPLQGEVVQKKKRGRPKKNNPDSAGKPSLLPCNSSVTTGEGEAITLDEIKQEEKDNKELKCQGCDVAFVSPTKLKKHVASCDSLKSTVSFSDGISFSRTKHEESGQDIKCKDCNVAFVSQSQLNKHQLTCKRLKSTGKESVLRRAKVAAPKPVHTCPVCHKKFVKRNGVKRHLALTHSSLVHISCALCYKKIGDVHENYEHIKSQHRSAFPPEGVNPSCPVCGETSQKYSDIKLHITNVHSNLVCITCALCQRSVSSMLNYLQHFYAFHVSSSSESSDVSTIAPSSNRTQNKGPKTSPAGSELICIQCNKSVENYKLLILHTLSHKLDENMELASKDSNSNATSESRNVSDKQCLDKNSAESEKAGENHLNSLDEFPISLSMLPEEAHKPVSSRFSYLGYDLVLSLNRSLRTMTEMSSRLQSELEWSNAKPPSSRKELTGKLNEVLKFTSGITDIGKCLLLVLEESQQFKEKDPLAEDSGDENYNDDTVGDDGDDQNNCKQENLSDNLSSKNENDQTEANTMSDVRSENGEGGVSHPKNNSLVGTNTGDFSDRNLKNEAEAAGATSNDCNEENEDVSCCKTQFAVGIESCTPSHGNSGNEDTLEAMHDTKGESGGSVDAPFCQQAVSGLEEGSEKSNVIEAVKVRPIAAGTKSGQSVTNIRKKKKYICKKCGKQLAKSSSLTHHQLVHQEARPYQCKVCLLRYKCQNHLTRHSLIHLKDNKYKCDFCDYSSKALTTLHQHMNQHSEEEVFSCDRCKHQSRTSYDLARHKKIHEPKICKFCDFQANHLYELKAHERKTHLKLTCSKCDFACFASHQLERHLKTHEIKEAIYCCELCGATFNTKRKLNYHMVRHSNKTPLSCPHCDYRCSSRASYDGHLLKHAGLRPYLCPICGAGFQRSNYLNRHALMHSDVTKFECKTCGKRFKYKYNYKEHLMIHTGEKRFKCHLCNFACQRRKLLGQHMAKHKARGSDVDVSENEDGSSKPEAS